LLLLQWVYTSSLANDILISKAVAPLPSFVL
jgi:hypothetical protein